MPADYDEQQQQQQQQNLDLGEITRAVFERILFFILSLA